jgi:hypothetical protein
LGRIATGVASLLRADPVTPNVEERTYRMRSLSQDTDRGITAALARPTRRPLRLTLAGAGGLRAAAFAVTTTRLAR